MVPGDIIIQFNGSNPANSAGNAGHAQMYLGTIGGSRLVIHSSGGGLKVVKYGNGWFSNEWHFRYKSLTTPLTAADRVDSQVTPWKYETYTAPANTVLHKRLQVTPEDGRVVYLQRFLPYWKRWINYSQSATGDSGIVPFDIPMFKGRMSWRLTAPATVLLRLGPAAVFIGSYGSATGRWPGLQGRNRRPLTCSATPARSRYGVTSQEWPAAPRIMHRSMSLPGDDLLRGSDRSPRECGQGP
jgi:hypothetical protein